MRLECRARINVPLMSGFTVLGIVPFQNFVEAVLVKGSNQAMRIRTAVDMEHPDKTGFVP